MCHGSWALKTAQAVLWIWQPQLAFMESKWLRATWQCESELPAHLVPAQGLQSQTLSLCTTPMQTAALTFPPMRLTCVKKRFRSCLAIPRLCVAWWAALTLLSGTFSQRMAEHCAYPSLPNSKFKPTRPYLTLKSVVLWTQCCTRQPSEVFSNLT